MIKLRQPSWPKQNSVGAPSVKKVPQGGSCISIKLVSWNGVAFAVTPFFLFCARWGAAGRLLPFPPGSVRAEYPIRTVIQFSICPSIGRQREGPKINPLNNQLGTFLPFAQKNFCKLFVNGGYNDKKSRYTAHQISGRKSLALSLMKLCTGSAFQKPSMSAFSAPLADSATGAAQPQFLSTAALCFISDIQLLTLLWEQNIV